jgi:hypothetical protein
MSASRIFIALVMVSSNACAEGRIDSLFQGNQTIIAASAEVDTKVPNKFGIVVHLKNSSSFALCAPIAFLPQNGILQRRLVELLDDRGGLVEYTGLSSYYTLPYMEFHVIPSGYTSDIYYSLSDSFRLVSGEKYRIEVQIDAFDCGALKKGYVFPQRQRASEWEKEYDVPAVDLRSDQMYTFDSGSFSFSVSGR